MKCLLIETKDKRKFFTHERNFTQLVEFSKTFGAEISVVKIQGGPILELEELAPAICDPAYKKPKAEYELLHKKVETTRRKRPAILRNAKKIKSYILNEFKTGGFVSLTTLKKRFRGLSEAALCNHLSRARKELAKEGVQCVKVKAGTYRCMI